MKFPVNSYIKSFIPLIVLAAAVGGFYIFAVHPARAELDRLESELDNINTKIERQRAPGTSVPELESRIRETRKRYEVLYEKVPGEAQTLRMVRGLSEIAQQSGVSLTSLTPTEDAAAEEAPDAAGKVYVKLKLKTDFRGLGKFLEGLESAQMLFDISQMNAKKLPEERLLEVNMEVVSFYKE